MSCDGLCLANPAATHFLKGAHTSHSHHEAVDKRQQHAIHAYGPHLRQVQQILFSCSQLKDFRKQPPLDTDFILVMLIKLDLSDPIQRNTPITKTKSPCDDYYCKCFQPTRAKQRISDLRQALYSRYSLLVNILYTHHSKHTQNYVHVLCDSIIFP